MSGIRWIPVESNPKVMNEWAKQAGLVTAKYQFTDVYGFDDDLLSLVPQPVKAIVLLFPSELHPKRREEDARIQQTGQHPIDPNVIWIKQTIGNACGTMGILHALLNLDSDATITPGTFLANLIDDCKGKDGFERARILEGSSFLAEIHDTAARTGQSAVPATLDTSFHYTCFVETPDPSSQSDTAHGDQDLKNRVIELDGERFGAIDRGECGDLLRDAVRVIQEKYVSQTNNPGFTMIALAPAL